MGSDLEHESEAKLNIVESLMPGNLADKSACRTSVPLTQQFIKVRDASLQITKSLSPEDQMLQSMPDASPTKWHLAHTTWFFETFILLPNSPGYKAFDERYQFLFNSYYKRLGSHPNRGSRGLMSRPSLEEVRAYRAHVDSAILTLLQKHNGDETERGILSLIEVGLNHEQQHQELILTDIKHALWSTPLPLKFRKNHGEKHAKSDEVRWIEVEGGIHDVGYEGDGFSFDNELPRHQALLRPFQIASRAVTNEEFLEFMADNGYGRPELWLSDGWDAVNSHGWKAPLYWEMEGKSWFHFFEREMREVPPAEPVCHISFYEADAYARWQGARLPSEEEWEIAAARSGSRGTMLEDNVFHPQPAKGEGMQQAFGDVWEWTASSYSPYPGFKPAAGLLGEYNGKFMCNQMVLRGGSCVTPTSHIRASYRNFFPPHARWQFSGMRLAK